MKGDGPSTVIIRGQHIGHPLTATWSKQLLKVEGKVTASWSLTIQYRGRQRRFAVDRREKACWTVTITYVDLLFQSVGKPYVAQHAKQISKEQGLRIVR